MKTHPSLTEKWINHLNGYLTIKGYLITIQQKQSLDLYKFVQAYREHWTVENFLDSYPECANEERAVRILWKEFRRYSQKELADLAIDMIHEFNSEEDKE